MKEPRNILIVRTDRIGDVVLSLPLAGLIKKHFPNCKVTFLLRNYTKELADKHPFIDGVLVLREEQEKILLRANVKMLREKSFDTCIVVSPTFLTALMVFLSGIKKRVGSGYRLYSFLFNKKVFEHRKYADKHELEFNVNLLKEIGINEQVSVDNVNFDLKVNPTSLELVKKILRDSNIDLTKKLIIAHPGSGGSSIDLPVEKFAEFIGKLTKLDNITVVITGDKKEQEICRSVVGDSNAINLSGKFNLSGIIGLISMCSLFASNSTGPIHIAAALGKATIGFYPKIKVCSSERWGPFTGKKAVFKPEIDCFNCSREQCEKLDCMNSIDIDNVISEAIKLLA